ncbi:MAG: thiamine pyrophosphate-dependent dehydrogenase E1 component subunit alpha [Acidimicrobiia bacterium]|jgi:pyruvate dehydrogenase E1 component alpha subunit
MTEDIQTSIKRGWYRRMVEIRLFEERVQELFAEGLIPGTTHLCQGQEAVSVGVIDALGVNDKLSVTYRGHGHALALGMPLESAFAELLGRRTGCCGGVGGSMHLADLSRGLLGSFAIVGASLPVGLGAAMTSRLTDSGYVSVAFCGDGATNIGTFHETLNVASLWNAPVVFVIENNLYAEYTPLQEATAVEDLFVRAKAHDMVGVPVDGQDIFAVHSVASEAVDRARRGDGPTLIEAKTYRFRGHSRTDPAKYRKEGELEDWLARDPIDLLGERLVEGGRESDAGLLAVREEARTRVDAAAQSAIDSPYPSMEDAAGWVYA